MLRLSLRVIAGRPPEIIILCIIASRFIMLRPDPERGWPTNVHLEFVFPRFVRAV